MPTVDSGIAYYYGTLLSQVCHLSRPGPQLGAAVSAVPLVIACNRAVDDQVFQIRVVAAMLMHLCPDALVSPTGESFVDAVPVPVFGWQQSPLGPRAVNP